MEEMSEALGLAHCKDLRFLPLPDGQLLKAFEQRRNTIFKRNPLQGFRIHLEDKSKRVRESS